MAIVPIKNALGATITFAPSVMMILEYFIAPKITRPIPIIVGMKK